MTVSVIPFPLARRQDLVERQAAWFAEQRHGAAEHNLKRLLRVQYDALVRRGVATELAAVEVEALRLAILHAVRLRFLTPEVTA